MENEFGAPKLVDRSSFQAELETLRVREKAHTREGETWEDSPAGWPQPRKASSICEPMDVPLLSGLA